MAARTNHAQPCRYPLTWIYRFRLKGESALVVRTRVYLQRDPQAWPSDDKFQNLSASPSCELREKAKPVCTTLVVEERQGLEQIIDCRRFSSHDKLLRITSYVMRFVDNASRRQQSADLDSEEIQQAEVLWLREVQKKVRANPEFKQTKRALGLYEDEQGISRTRGRIGHAPLPYTTRYPAILPRDHRVTELIVKRSHKNVMHNAVTETLVELRSRYWIVNGRQVIRKFLSTCATGKRIEGTNYPGPLSPPLPQFRVSDDYAYSYIGVEFAGPVNVRDIFIFMRSLQRFGRRGLPATVVSDNDKTFRSLTVKAFAQQKRITWKYNAPKAPWWGGFFERMVRCAKCCLKKTMGNVYATFEEFDTVMIQVDGILILIAAVHIRA